MITKVSAFFQKVRAFLQKVKAFLQKVKTFFFKGWLIEAIFLTCLTLAMTVTVAFVTDRLYKVSIGSKVFKTGQLTMADQNGNNPNATGNTSNSATNGSNQGSTSNTATTNQPTTNATTQTAPPSSAPPSSLPPATPPPAPSGCFVTVNGYLYNMQSAIGVVLTDPNTSKTRNHTSGNFHCGSFSAPTNMTSTYLSKHSGMGCADRLAPYIYTPPAPKDPSCP